MIILVHFSPLSEKVCEWIGYFHAGREESAITFNQSEIFMEFLQVDRCMYAIHVCRECDGVCGMALCAVP